MSATPDVLPAAPECGGNGGLAQAAERINYFDDLQYDVKVQDFAKDPRWEGSGNRDTYQDRERSGCHDYGFSATTHFTGSEPGELGGIFWRSGQYSFYADRVGARFDRFCVFTPGGGGQIVRIYLDDLEYTVRSNR